MKLQPNSLNCFVCGVNNPSGLHMKFYETGDEPVEVCAEYTVPEQFQGYPGVAHGGIVASMLDEVVSRTIFRGDPPRFVVTAKLSVRYRKPVPIQTLLRLTGRVIEDRGRVIKVAGEIIGPDGEILAEADAVLTEVDPAFFEHLTAENQTWTVYPQSPNEV